MHETVSFGGDIYWSGRYWVVLGLARYVLANTGEKSAWQRKFCERSCDASGSICYWEFDDVSTEEFQTLRALLDQLVQHPEIAFPNWKPEWKPDAEREYAAIRDRVVQRIAQLTDSHT